MFFIIFLNSGNVFPQEQSEVISSFEKQVDKFEKFFSSKPKLLEKQSYKDSPTGFILFYNRFDDYKISYDIRKTDSLVSPYMGYITLSYLESSSKKCGGLEGYKSKFSEEKADKYFTTIESARQKRDDESCYKYTRIGKGELRRTAKFIFAIQKKQWVLKDVLNIYNNESHPTFYTTFFGKPFGGRFYVKDNDFWKKLIE